MLIFVSTIGLFAILTVVVVKRKELGINFGVNNLITVSRDASVLDVVVCFLEFFFIFVVVVGVGVVVVFRVGLFIRFVVVFFVLEESEDSLITMKTQQGK